MREILNKIQKIKNKIQKSLLVLFIVIILLLVYQIKEIKDIKDHLDSLLGIINVLIVIYFFNQQEEKNLKEEIEKKKTYWLQNLSLEKYIEVINNFFIDSDLILNETEGKNISSYIELSDRFDEGRRKIECYILDIVYIIDEPKYQEAMEIIQDDYDDTFKEGIEFILNSNDYIDRGRKKTELKNKGQEIKVRLLKCLYEIE